jgi:hypothetical protein
MGMKCSMQPKPGQSLRARGGNKKCILDRIWNKDTVRYLNAYITGKYYGVSMEINKIISYFSIEPL